MTAVTTPRKPRRPRPGARGSRIRADVVLAAGGGYQRYFDAWPQVGAWLASPQYLADSAAVTSVRLIHLHREEGASQ